MIKKYLVDTSKWIQWGRSGFSTQEFPSGPASLLLAAPVLAELEVGRLLANNKSHREQNSHLIESIQRVAEPVHFELEAAKEFAYLKVVTNKAGRPRSALDLMIAAIARVHRAEVLTRDERASFAELLALPPRPAA